MRPAITENSNPNTKPRRTSSQLPSKGSPSLWPAASVTLVFCLVSFGLYSVLDRREDRREGMLLQTGAGPELISQGASALPEITLALGLLSSLSIGALLAVLQRVRRHEAALEVEKARAEELLRELEIRNQDLRTMLYVTSHDLREPLRAIRFFSGRLLESHHGDMNEKGRDFLTRIDRAGERLDTLIEEILLLSRAQRQKLSLARLPTNLVLDTVEERLGHKIRETGAVIRREEPLPALVADRMWATQALYNLVGNALKFTVEGRAPEIDVRGVVEDGRPGLVVADRGPGVRAEHADRIFQLFQRAVPREVEGSGAGLAIVRQIANRHSGQVRFRPRQDGGSEFIITFAHPKDLKTPNSKGDDT